MKILNYSATLANQTAIAIENARLYEDLKRSKTYILRADRLASLGTLTAGLAHEIRIIPRWPSRPLLNYCRNGLTMKNFEANSSRLPPER